MLFFTQQFQKLLPGQPERRDIAVITVEVVN